MRFRLAIAIGREFFRMAGEPAPHTHNESRWPGRCAICGHRLPTNGIPVIETRKLPMRVWPSEVRDRARAILAG